MKLLEDNDDSIIKAVAAVIVVLLVIAATCFIVEDAAREDAASQHTASKTLVLDCTNAAAMHKYGMPCAEDVMNYKMYGSWGYKDSNGEMHMYRRLPGDMEAWYELYDI